MISPTIHESKHMTLDTENTIYFCADRTNAEVKVLLPKSLKLEIIELRLDDPDPESTDDAEYKLLAEEMTELTFEV